MLPFSSTSIRCEFSVTSIVCSSMVCKLCGRLKECGEALLVDVSEVLFNELAFFRLMQTMGG